MSFVESTSRVNDYFSRLEVDDEDGNEFTDRWNTGELLYLASAVQRSGDKNWVSVSRSIKPFGEPKRPADWYTPKNCALQYSKLLKGVEDFKKKSLPRTERETSEELVVKNLTDKRLNELIWLNQQTKAVANSLKSQLEMVESGEFDEHIDELLKKIDEQEKREEEDFKEWISKRESLNATKRLNKCRAPLSKGKAPSKALESKRKNSPNPDQTEETTISSIITDAIKIEVDTDDEFTASSKPIHVKTETDSSLGISALLDNKTPNTTLPSVAPTSPLLTSLLRNVPSTSPVSQAISSICSSPLKEVKVEASSHPQSMLRDTSTDISRKNEVFLSPSKIPTTGISPLLTSLLKSPTSTVPLTPTSTSMASLLKESDVSEAKLPVSVSEVELNVLSSKSRETSPKNTIPQSPRPAPASSPLLNSLLKNSPSTPSLSSIQIPQSKEAPAPKAVSSPQSFFNPTSALATAAAQQLAVATSTLPQSSNFFQQDLSESRKTPLQSPINSACLSAPTLSKLLEMPPSTPGRLPPLPVLDTTPSSSPVVVTDPVQSSPQKPTIESHNDDMPGTSTPNKKSSDESVTEHSLPAETSPVKKVDVFLVTEKKVSPVVANESSKVTSLDHESLFTRASVEVDDTSQENIDLLEEVYESLSQAYDKKEIKAANDSEENKHSSNRKLNEEPIQSISTNQISTQSTLNVEKISENVAVMDAGTVKFDSCSDTSMEKNSSLSADANKSAASSVSESDSSKKTDLESGTVCNIQSTTSEPESKVPESAEEERGIAGRKFYKSRVSSKKRTSTEEDAHEKSSDSSVSRSPVKKILKAGKVEVETTPLPVKRELSLSPVNKEEEECEKNQDSKLAKASEIRPPVCKKPRIFEKAVAKEKKDLSEDEAPLVKRPGRRAKKGRGKISKSLPVKPEEPKDQYEFSESTEENSVGYQAANTLCYMPRVKDDTRFEDSKVKQVPSSQISEDSTNIQNASSPSVEKKYFNTPLRSKQGKSTPQISSRKNLFASDEERMSDSLTSDEASNPLSGEDKLKKWKESNEKKSDTFKELDENVKATPRPSKTNDSPKKKFQQTKRNTFGVKNDSSNKKEKKSSSLELEELSACSRDSEDASGVATWSRADGEASEEKEQSNILLADVEPEANDSHMSSSVTAESDKQMDDVEGYESLQGSITTEFSPLPASEVKEEKDLTQFGKQDWYHGVSPKSSEPVSQSSEESEEYESDNWDNQSVSTNKSVPHSCGQQSRLKRKERESPQYKAWKKAISIVLREASCHKYANVFLQKVTNDVAPGYLSIVYRPMDLSLIKKNIDNGLVKTTSEFHRDMMLMFQNAIMYNSSDHDVHHMAIEMQRDVIQQIQAFLTTQTNDKDETIETASSLRGARTAKSQKVYSNATKSREETERE